MGKADLPAASADGLVILDLLALAFTGMKASEEEDELSTELKKIQRQWTMFREKIGLKHCCSEAVSHLLD
ncbi:myosin-IIIb [Platysternon megacephalum]|uniref:Myosin-IIIb n=1 Tax=Platysternon megacephalum TaxID=55544 RepID=A0A4D9ETL1_9SAUR|nr:myosin-IIIb [Platysternon megacephalum]